MGVLDTILINELVSSTETVNTNWESEILDITFREAEFSAQLNYDNGSSVNMELWIAVSLDGINFSRVDDSNQTITDNSGVHIWDISGSGTSFLRVEIEVTGGSIDITKLQVHQKRRH